MISFFFAKLKFLFLRAISLKVYTHSKYSPKTFKNWFCFEFPFLLPSNPEEKKRRTKRSLRNCNRVHPLDPWRQVIQSTILSCSSPAPYQISILGHSKPAHTSSPGRMMDGKLVGNSFLLASSSLANHRGYLSCLVFSYLSSSNQQVGCWWVGSKSSPFLCV